jgi:hypothetical protein
MLPNPENLQKLSIQLHSGFMSAGFNADIGSRNKVPMDTKPTPSGNHS